MGVTVDHVHSQTIWPVVGHEWAVQLLYRSLLCGRFSHAYLFIGPQGVGKTTLARALAQVMLCQVDQVADRPCGQCRACRLIQQDRHPDVRVVSPPAPDRPLSIEQVRELQRDASLSPMEGRARVFIIRELDRATPQAANALLKTLEEPPPHVLLLLTASQREALLPTVVSRCQVLTLRPLPITLVEATLQERWHVTPERAALLARLSNGCLGVAVATLDDQQGDAWRHQCLSEMAQIMAGDHGVRLQQAERLSQQGEMVRPTLAMWLGWWRDVMLTQARCHEQVINVDQRSAIEAAAQQWTTEQVREIIRRLRDTLQYIDANANVRLALETLFLSLPQPPSSSTMLD